MGQNRAYSGSFKATYDLVIAFHFYSAESNPICRQSRQQGLRTVLELPQHCRQRIRTNIRLNGIGLKEKVQVQKVSVSRNNIIHFFITYTFFANHFFYIFYSTIFPVSDYFFLLKISDWSKEYKPESKILMDIPSALNFFHKDPKFTLSMITSKVEKLANGWNSVFYKTDKEVCTNKHRFLTKNPYNVFQKVNYCFKIYLFVISDYAHPVTLF